MTRQWALMLCCALGVSSGAAASRRPAPDPLEPARAALRTLQFDRAVALLAAAGSGGNSDADYLLGVMYLNGVGVRSDPEHGDALLRVAAGHGHGAAAYVLAGELARDPGGRGAEARQWLERSAGLGYYRAVEALKSGRPPLDRESVGRSDPTLMMPWVLDCVRRDDVAELRRLGPVSAAVRDDFGRGSLSQAAEFGTAAAATLLLELGAGPNSADQAGVTALMIAAGRPDSSMLALLLAHGADVQALDNERRSALFYAARADRVENLKLLQQAGAVLESRDSRGYNALDAALGVGADQAAAALRDSGVRPNRVAADAGRPGGKFDPEHPGDIYRGWPPLALAVSRNDTARVQQLLESGGDANLRLPGGDSLLQVAADTHALGSVALLLAHHANPQAPDHAGHGALWMAASRNDLAVLEALLEAGVRPDSRTPAESTPLLAALRAKRADTAEALLAAGADVEARDTDGRTPLMLAAAAGETGLLKLLLEHRARADSQDHDHRTALFYAAASGARAAVELLLAAGADPQHADARGMTALHTAAAQSNAGVVPPLLAADLPLNGCEAGGDTPLLIAAAAGRVDVVRTLLEHRPDLDVQNQAGDTALIAASRGGHAVICRLLAAAGADTSLRNRAGISAADMAAGRGFAALAKELAGRG